MITDMTEVVHIPTKEIDELSLEVHEQNLLSLNAPIAPPKTTTRTWHELNRSHMKAKVEKNISQQITDVFEMIAFCKTPQGKTYYSKELRLNKIPELIQALEQNQTLPDFSIASLLWEEIKREGECFNSRTTDELTEVFKVTNSITRMALKHGMLGLAYRYGRSAVVSLGFRTRDWEGEQEPIRNEALRLLVNVAKEAKKREMHKLAHESMQCAFDFARTKTDFHDKVKELLFWSGDYSRSCSPPYVNFKKLNRLAAPAP